MAIFWKNDDVIKSSRDEMPIFLRFSKLLRTTYLFAKFCDLTHFQLDFKWGGRGVILPPLGENWEKVPWRNRVNRAPPETDWGLLDFI